MTQKLLPCLALFALLGLGAGCAVHAHPHHVAVRPARVRVHVPRVHVPRVHVQVRHRRCSHMECRRRCTVWGCRDRCRRVHHRCR